MSPTATRPAPASPVRPVGLRPEADLPMLDTVATLSTTSTPARSEQALGGVLRLLALWAVAAAGVGAVVAEVLIAIVAVLGGTDAGAVVELGVWTVPVAAVAAIALALLRRPHGD